MIHKLDLEGPRVAVGGQACLPGEEQCVQGLAPDVKLQLLGGGVAGADRTAAFIAGQPPELVLGKTARSVDAVEDLQSLGLASDRPQQPVPPRAGLGSEP